MTRTKFLKGECQHCGGHIEFPAESAGLTSDCPHCGKQTELFLATPADEPSIPRATIIYTIIAVVILVGGLIGGIIAVKRAQRMYGQRQKPETTVTRASPTNTSEPLLPTPVELALKAGFRVSMITLEKTPGTSLVYATGTVRNETTKRRFGVKIELDLFDTAGAKVGSTTDYQPSLEAKSEWHFKALVAESKAASAKLASLAEDQ